MEHVDQKRKYNMSVSWYEQFVGVDWARYAGIGGKVAVTSCFCFGIIDLVLRISLWAAIWSLFCGVIISIWEFPILFSCLPQLEAHRSFVVELFRLKKEEGRAAVSLALGVFCFMNFGFVTLSGISILISAILHIFAAVNRRADESMGIQSDFSPAEYPPVTARSADPSQSLIAAANRFGTF